MKTCNKCFLTKDISVFPRHPDAKDGHINQCRDCVNVSRRQPHRQPAIKKAGLDSKYRQYGIDAKQYQVMFVGQGGGCWICEKQYPDRDLAIDHDHSCCASRKHSCGKCVRALLCDACNQALGKFKESEDLLLRAVDYLRKFKLS